MYTARQYIRHLFRCQSRYSIHSPFVYDFVTKVLPPGASDETRRVQQLYQQLKQDKTSLKLEGFGAKANSRQTTIAAIARKSASGHRKGSLLHRICKHYQPRKALELGTNLGIGTAWQATALAANIMTTIEGEMALHTRASQNLEQLGLHVNTLQGSFEEVLPTVDLSGLAYAFLDGNHTYEATLAYVQQLMPHLIEGGMLMLDDIYWSPGMTKAWEELKPQFDISIDLFHVGLLVKRDQARQDFRMLLI